MVDCHDHQAGPIRTPSPRLPVCVPSWVLSLGDDGIPGPMQGEPALDTRMCHLPVPLGEVEQCCAKVGEPDGVRVLHRLRGPGHLDFACRRFADLPSKVRDLERLPRVRTEMGMAILPILRKAQSAGSVARMWCAKSTARGEIATEEMWFHGTTLTPPDQVSRTPGPEGAPAASAESFATGPRGYGSLRQLGRGWQQVGASVPPPRSIAGRFRLVRGTPRKQPAKQPRHPPRCF